MILVIGATGNIGKEVVTQLAARGQAVRALIHVKPPSFEVNENIQLVHGDLGRLETIEAAMDGVEKVFLLTPGAELDLEGNTLKAAKSLNVKHIVKLSRFGASPDAGYVVSRRHGQIEEQIRESGIPFTFIRASALMQTLYMFLGTIQSAGAFYSCTGEGKMSLVDTRDIGEAAAKVLTEPGHEGQTYTLTGPASLSYGEVAASLSAGIGKPVAYVDLPIQAIEQSFNEFGFPASLVAEYMEVLIDLKQGGMDGVTSDFTSITGHAPRSFDQFAAEMGYVIKLSETGAVSH